MRYLKSFEYYEPPTLKELSHLLKKLDGKAKVLAGGTDLLVKMKAGAVAPKYVINLKAVDDDRLRGIKRKEDGAIEIGSLVTLQSIRDSDVINVEAQILSNTAALMASPQVRNIATIGGNLCNASPSADMAPPLLAMDAKVVTYGEHHEERSFDLEEFFSGPGETILEEDEILLTIKIPKMNPLSRMAYEKFAQRGAMALATVGVAVRLNINNHVIDDARIVLGAVAPTPIRARCAEEMLLGRETGKLPLEEACQAAVEETKPISDVRGSAQFRLRLVRSLVRKAVGRVLERS